MGATETRRGGRLDLSVTACSTNQTAGIVTAMARH
jgi:hypothetical protein